MTLDLSSLENAIAALQRSISVAQSEALLTDEDMREVVRAGVIQHFEVAYELSWKFLQRWIRENQTPEDADHPRTRKELFRQAARYGLISNPEAWFGYGDARNLTSHTYNESQAELVYDSAKRFYQDAKYLLEQLKASND